MPQTQWIAKDVALIHDFLSAAECDAYIGLSEGIGFADAPVNTARGMVMMKELRNNERVMLDDAARAASLWERLRPAIPVRFKKRWQPVGLNERLRFYRYDPGQQFDWHHDGYFGRDSGERSFFTFMVYLNDGFDGGETAFAHALHGGEGDRGFRVRPQAGRALMFHHPILHKGEPVLRGRKYVLRTDVMYAEVARAAAEDGEAPPIG
ncbi:MAG: 2OG-Fe(II) oxygenase [Alphaproteobacteria bacterium]|nr:2OG-Fe(II) oxygenase [Alphaproteobacteria bacterium]